MAYRTWAIAFFYNGGEPPDDPPPPQRQDRKHERTFTSRPNRKAEFASVQRGIRKGHAAGMNPGKVSGLDDAFDGFESFLPGHVFPVSLARSEVILPYTDASVARTAPLLATLRQFFPYTSRLHGRPLQLRHRDRG